MGDTERLGGTGACAFGTVGKGTSAGMFGLIGAAAIGSIRELAVAKDGRTARGWDATYGGGRSGFVWVWAGRGAALGVGVGLTASFDATAGRIGCGVNVGPMTGKRVVT